MPAPKKKSMQPRKVVVISRAKDSSWARIHYGALVEHDAVNGTATLDTARQCLFYSRETGGEVGLAAIGPQDGSRLSPMAPGLLHVSGVGTVQDASPAAQAKWEAS